MPDRLSVIAVMLVLSVSAIPLSSPGSTAASANLVAKTIAVGNDPNGIAFVPSNNDVYVTNYADGTVSVIDASTNNVIQTFKVGDNPIGIAFAPSNGDVYVANSGDSTVSVIDTSTNNVLQTIAVGHGPVAVAFAPVNNDVYVANYWDGNVSVIDTSSNAVIKTTNVGHRPNAVGFASSNNGVYVANLGDLTVSVINASTNNVFETINVGLYPYGVAFAPIDGDVYVTNSGDNTLSVISTPATVPEAVTVNCQPATIALNPIARGYSRVRSVCTAAVEGKTSVPTGSVKWSADMPGWFSPLVCSLRQGECATTFTSSLSGPTVITATYRGSRANPPGSGSFGLSVSPAVPRTIITCKPTFAKANSTRLIGCVAQVIGFKATGTVQFFYSGTGTVAFKTETCTLSRAHACRVLLRAMTPGWVFIQGVYSGDWNNEPSVGPPSNLNMIRIHP
ncbi:MAG TPA: YncE family protein [Nitrososphaerales archaeon]|nr:YncE family protein [Nitrososphaerales archaeon]